jgi:glycosyltransferase involved in cell wall biosynthesis
VNAIEAGLRALARDHELRERLRSLGLARAASFSWTETGRLTLSAYRRAILG